MDRTDGYEVVGSFDCRGVGMVVVKTVHGTHVMPGDEWELIKKGFLKNSTEHDPKIEKYKVA